MKKRAFSPVCNFMSSRTTLPCFLVLFALTLFFLGCAPPYVEHPPDPEETSPEQLWSQFWSRQKEHHTPAAYSMQGSLHILTPDEEGRLSYRLHGNHPTPVQLRLSAGFGTTVSVWEVQSDQVRVFLPRENEAYITRDTRQALAALGIELPFSLPELLEILAGDWANILWTEHDRAEYLQEEEGWAFFPERPSRIDRIILDYRARLISLSGSWPQQWSIRRSDFQQEDGFLISRRGELTAGEEQEMILTMNSFEPNEEVWPEEDLRITLPADTKIRTLMD